MTSATIRRCGAMKFKATLTARGMRVLERGFLPTLEKLGKSCAVLLGPEDVHLLQGAAEAGGLHVVARLARSVLFDEGGGYSCESRYRNLIAFAVDIALMLKVCVGGCVARLCVVGGREGG